MYTVCTYLNWLQFPNSKKELFPQKLYEELQYPLIVGRWSIFEMVCKVVEVTEYQIKQTIFPKKHSLNVILITQVAL